MTGRITIAEVAKEAGVSIATVSRVLNQREGKIRISDETKAAVMKAAQRLGYQADPFASALRTRRSGLVGAIIRDLRDPFLIELFIEMQNAARAKGIELLLANANFDLNNAGRQASIMNSLWFDGMILLGDLPGDPSVIGKFQQSQKPCVAVASGIRSDLPSINIDEESGVRLALDYLTGLGHRRIAGMGDMKLLGIQERISFFTDYASQHGLVLLDGYLVDCPNNVFKAAQQVSSIMALPQPPTAIFCSTDLMAVGVLLQLHRQGIRVPEDVSVIGFDDIEGAASTYPALTTVRQNMEELAEQALSLVIRLLDEPADNKAPEIYLIKPELVIRESCGAPLPSGETICA